MLTPFINGDAREISTRKLEILKAHKLAAFLQRPKLPFVRLLECWRPNSGTAEAVVFEVEVELGQKKIRDIRQHEAIGVVFDPSDKIAPEVLALREDFPVTPHQNIRSFARPRSLCLDEEPYSEQKLRWSALAFVERIREWLRLTARGELHQEDQPLEPLLSDAGGTIILPRNFVQQHGTQNPSVVAVELLNDSHDKPIYRIHPKPTELLVQQPRFIATVFETLAVEHGIIHTQPANLYELHDFCQKIAKYDLLGELRARLRDWIVQKTAGDIGKARLVLIAVFPKKRQANSQAEYPDIWVFCFPANVHQIAVALGVEGEKKIGGHAGVIIGEDKQIVDASLAQKIGIVPLRSVYTLTPASAASFNGFDKPIRKRIVAVGMGALGSQVFNNMMRSGFGEWTLVDKDILLPHNCARHALPGNFVGCNKTDGLAFTADATLEGASPTRSIPVDVLDPGDRKDELTKAFADANSIFDFSASVAVARHLASDVASKACRVSVFLNPVGTDLVVLKEDAARKLPLVWLEMEYYRLLANEEPLFGHLARDGGRIRYARSCGDISSRTNQNLVALHAAISSQILRQMLERDAACIAIFRADPVSFVVRKFVFVLPRFKVERTLDWTVFVSKLVLGKVHRVRKERLPKETGGVLVGGYDRQRRVIYVLDALSSPKDSTEWPNLYIRGVRGLRAELERIKTATLSNLEYVGEWHSHPSGSAPSPSPTDRRALATLGQEMSRGDLPALMLIVADRHRQGFFIG